MGTKLSLTGTDGSGNIRISEADAQIRGDDTNGPALLNESASTTNPTVVPDRAQSTSGLGGSSADLSLIVSGAQVGAATTTGLQGTIHMASLTIASGAVALPSHALASVWLLTIDTEGAASSDNLDQITGLVAGDIAILQSTDNTRDVTARSQQSGSGQMFLAGNTSFTHTATTDKLVLVARSSAAWDELSRSDNS